MKKVLIITYYWIPSGGAGVQRWVKFAKYLRSFGWEPVIYTPENPEYPAIDHSFEKDIPSDIQIVKTPIWEPYNIYRSLFGKKGEAINAGFISENKKQGWKDKLSIWIRGNFLIPDPRRFWIKSSVKFLTKFLKENPVDAVISTGPPHSMHLIGMGVKRVFPDLPWVADFRDPWTNIDFYQELNLTWLADKIHHRLEKKVVRTADCLVTVSDDWMRGFAPMDPRMEKVITNGFDPDDMEVGEVVPDVKFSISHIGTLNAARNPKVLWSALRALCDENSDLASDLQIKLVGKIDFSVLDDIEKAGLKSNLRKMDYLPHHEAIKEQKSSRVLLLLINRTQNAGGVLTGKFYEYMASGRPVFAIGPLSGNAADTLRETKAGVMVDFDDVEAAKKAVLDYYQLYKAGELKVNPDSVSRFSRKNLTGRLALLLDELHDKARGNRKM